MIRTTGPGRVTSREISRSVLSSPAIAAAVTAAIRRWTVDPSAPRTMAASVTIAVLLAGAIAWAAQALPEGEGRAVVTDRCASCHDLDRVVRAPRARDGWISVIGRMVENGARLDDCEREPAVSTSHHPG